MHRIFETIFIKASDRRCELIVLMSPNTTIAVPSFFHKPMWDVLRAPLFDAIISTLNVQRFDSIASPFLVEFIIIVDPYLIDLVKAE